MKRSSVIGSLVLTVTLIIVFGLDKNGWQADFGTVLKDGVATSPLIGVICMFFSLAVTATVSLFTKKPDDETLFAAFDKEIEGEKAITFKTQIKGQDFVIDSHVDVEIMIDGVVEKVFVGSELTEMGKITHAMKSGSKEVVVYLFADGILFTFIMHDAFHSVW